MLSEQEWAEKWASRMAGSTAAMQKGADRVTVSPGEKAIASKEKYRQRVMAALDDGTYEAGNKSYTTEDWRRAYKDKGIQRVASGATAAKPKVMAYARVAGPIAQASSEQCSQMPNTSDEQALEIVRVNMANMKRIKQQYRRR